MSSAFSQGFFVSSCGDAECDSIHNIETPKPVDALRNTRL